MTYDEAIKYLFSLNLDDKILEKALNYIDFVAEINPYKRKLTDNEEKRLKQIIESK